MIASHTRPTSPGPPAPGRSQLRAGQPAAPPRRRPGGALHALREDNIRRVLEVIGIDGGLSQAEVGRRAGLSRATVSNLVAELRRRGLVRESPAGPGGRGGLEVAVAGEGVIVGVDYGDRHVRVGLADLSGRVLAEEVRPLSPDAGLNESCAEARGLIGRLLDRSGRRREDVLQVGVGLPVPIDTISGRVLWHPLAHGWAELDPGAILEEALQLPVLIDNDGNLGALGELRQGAARGLADVIYVNVATRVEAGFIFAGRLHRGAAGTAGEIGHMTVDPHGQTCRCGYRGCLDTVVGRSSFLEPLRDVYGPQLTMDRVIELAEHGDMRCHRALSDAGRALGVVIADLCNLLGPQRVIVAGPIFGAGEIMLGPLRETVEHRAVPAAARAVEIVRSPLDERAELLGAMWLALDSVRSRTTGNALVPEALAVGRAR